MPSGRWSRSERSRSSAPGRANCVAPSPATNSRGADGPLLHRFQNRIHDAEAARDRFGGDGFTREDAVAGEHLLRDCRRPASGAILRSGDRLCDEPHRPRPRRHQAARPERRRFGAPCRSPRRASTRERAQARGTCRWSRRLPRQVPQRVDGLPRISAPAAWCNGPKNDAPRVPGARRWRLHGPGARWRGLSEAGHAPPSCPAREADRPGRVPLHADWLGRHQPRQLVGRYSAMSRRVRPALDATHTISPAAMTHRDRLDRSCRCAPADFCLEDRRGIDAPCNCSRRRGARRPHGGV